MVTHRRLFFIEKMTDDFRRMGAVAQLSISGAWCEDPFFGRMTDIRDVIG